MCILKFYMCRGREDGSGPGPADTEGKWGRNLTSQGFWKISGCKLTVSIVLLTIKNKCWLCRTKMINYTIALIVVISKFYQHLPIFGQCSKNTFLHFVKSNIKLFWHHIWNLMVIDTCHVCFQFFILNAAILNSFKAQK